VELHSYFDAKVADVRALTDSTQPPSFSSAPSGCMFVKFRSLTIDDVTAAIWLLPDKQCMSDPLPTSLLKLVTSGLWQPCACRSIWKWNQLDRLQSVINAAALFVCSARKYEHITPLFCDLHNPRCAHVPLSTCYCSTVPGE